MGTQLRVLQLPSAQPTEVLTTTTRNPSGGEFHHEIARSRNYQAKAEDPVPHRSSVSVTQQAELALSDGSILKLLYLGGA